jgi:hypothetical protein
MATHQSICVIGPPAIGKSALIREFLFKQLFVFSNNSIVDHITMSHTTKDKLLKKALERRMELKINPDTNQKYLMPVAIKNA